MKPAAIPGHTTGVAALHVEGHTVTDLDLYREGLKTGDVAGGTGGI
jgi:hypothetical protein